MWKVIHSLSTSFPHVFHKVMHIRKRSGGAGLGYLSTYPHLLLLLLLNIYIFIYRRKRQRKQGNQDYFKRGKIIMRCVENDCCGCATESYPCRGDSCSYRHSVHLYCDKCKNDVEKIYEYEDYDLCEDCLLDEFESVDIDTVDWQDI